MGIAQTNETAVAYSVEATPGVLAGTPTWKTVKINNFQGFGAQIETVARNPISNTRDELKGAVVDLDSPSAFELDLTMDHLIDFGEGFFFATFKGGRVVGSTLATQISVAASAYTVPTMASAIAQNTLVFGRGFSNAANNGLKVVDTGGTTTSIPIVGGGMVVEATTFEQNATVEVCGVQGATGDIQVNASGNLTSTALDWTTLGLTVGQWIYVGGSAAATQFASAENRGFARIRAITATVLTIEKKATTFVVDAGTGKTIHVYFGRFLRNVASSSADFLRRTWQFEAAYENLGVTPGSDEYEYSKGNYANTLGINFNLTDKATMALGGVGLDTLPPDTTRATNAATPQRPTAEELFNGSTDFLRLRAANYASDAAVTLDFTNCVVNLNNNVSPRKVLGTLGAKYINVGNFQVTVDMDILFASHDIPTAIRDNTDLAFDVAMRNPDGGFVFDIPRCTASGGNRTFPENEIITLSAQLRANRDPFFGFSASLSVFPFVPAT